MQKKFKIWHPFTQHALSDDPIKVVSGKGAKLKLADGREVIDAISSWWVNIHGHCHPKIVAAIEEQTAKLEHVIFAEFTHDPAEQVAEKVSALLPPALNHIFFSDNGSTSVEAALKIAYQYHYNLGKPRLKFYAFEGAYHGDTIGAMSLGRSSFSLPFLNLLFEVEVFPYGELEQIEKALAKEKDQVAAVIIEPLVQGVGGMRMTTPDFMQKLSKLVKDAGVLMIYDEVMTGFGRTGDYFACLRCNTVPDIICLAKGLTGGFLPLALTCVTESVFEPFLSKDVSKTFFHGHSYTANPIACAAASASLDLLKARPFDHLESKHRKRLDALASHPHLENGRVMGTIAAIDLKGEKGYFRGENLELMRKFLDRGVLLRPLGQVIYFMPPYCITDEELDKIFDVL